MRAFSLRNADFKNTLKKTVKKDLIYENF